MAHERVRHWEKFEESAQGRHPIKWWWQRLTRGYDDREVAALDAEIVAFVHPRLAHFVEWQLEHGKSCPEGLDPSSWLNILNKMNRAFELLSDSYFGKPDLSHEPIGAGSGGGQIAWIRTVLTDEEKDAVKDGTELFGRYLTGLREP